MLISLTTDFGARDGYVGTMKGVMAQIAPGVPFVDITHEIPPQDVRSAAYVLWTALPYFPEESVHLVVVDPGVGTARRPIAARTPWGVLVGPDNGVFSYVWAVAPPDVVVELVNLDYRLPVVSSTFHGRDVFAPAAAHLARGVPLEEFGPAVMSPVRLETPRVLVEGRRLRGQVLYVDRFGNAITSIGRLVWDGRWLHLDPAFGTVGGSRGQIVLDAARIRVRVGEHDVGHVYHTYGEVGVGAPLALVGSEGMLEVAINRGNGAEILGIHVGDEVEVLIKS